MPQSEKKNITEIDCIGLRCPLPVLKLQKMAKDMPSGSIITVLSDDPVSGIDIPHWAQSKGHKLVEKKQDGANICYFKIKIRDCIS
jgi:tRNA 2-thiouridine synthesizing protein A